MPCKSLQISLLYHIFWILSFSMDSLKPRLHRQCEHDATCLRQTKLRRLQRSQKGYSEVATKYQNSLETKLVASCLLSMQRRLAATDLVARRFYWSPRGLQAVLFSSPIGFRLWRSGLGTHCNPVATCLRLISDEAAMDLRLICDWSVLSCKVVSECAIISHWIYDMSPTCLVCTLQHHFVTRIQRKPTLLLFQFRYRPQTLITWQIIQFSKATFLYAWFSFYWWSISS